MSTWRAMESPRVADTLEEVLADERGAAQVLRANGHAHDAELIERVCDRVSAAAQDYLRWLSEPDARLRSGRSAAWLRARFPEWASEGHAELRRGVRYYPQCVIPQRADITAAREAGLRGESPHRERRVS